MNQSSIKLRSAGPIIRQVSQVSFAVGGEAPFERTVRETAIWMQNRNRAIPQIALDGDAFDVGGGGDSPARAVALDFEDGRLWAASLDDPDKNVVGRTWVTEITVAERAGRVLFGTRLINVTRGVDAPYVPSLPGLSRQIIGRLPAIADQLVLSDVAQRVANPDEVDDLIALLDDPSRKLPVVAIANGAVRELFAEPDVILPRFGGHPC